MFICLWIGQLPDAWAFAVTCHGTSLYILCIPLAMSHLLVEYPCYDEGHCTFHLQGLLSDILEVDHRSVSDIVAFLNGIGVAKSI
jgi:hypothetical protein